VFQKVERVCVNKPLSLKLQFVDACGIKVFKPMTSKKCLSINELKASYEIILDTQVLKL
jgi:hypothetical protein